MKIRYLIIFSLITIIFGTTRSFALIKIDNDSIDLAIKYGIKSKDLIKRDLLGSNWINDQSGRILNIYSPFIQIAVKTSNQNTTGNLENDLKTIKQQLSTSISKIEDRNEVRFILDFYGDTENFAQNYKAYIIDVDKYNDTGNDRYIIKPKKASLQKIAAKDGFDPLHPYSAFNCYIFKFDDLTNLKEYFFVLTNGKGEEIKYKINNQEIF